MSKILFQASRQWRQCCVLIRVGCVLLISACSFAPLTPRIDAASLPKGNVRVAYTLTPSSSVSMAYGVTDKLDVGATLEQYLLGKVWARHSFINNPDGWSVAGDAGAFVSEMEYRSNGFYLGGSVSNQITPQFRVYASYRYALLDYEYSPSDSSNFFSLLDFDNPEDGSETGQLDINLTYNVSEWFALSVGGTCQHLPRNNDPDIEDELCLPMIGFSIAN